MDFSRGASGLYDTVSMADFLAGHSESEFIERYGNSLFQSGFVVLDKPGVDDAVIARAYEAAAKLFTYSDEQLMRYSGKDIGGQRGFTPYKTERAKTQKAANLMRFWMVGDPVNPEQKRLLPNRWPDELVPEFRPAIMAFYEQMRALNNHLLYAQEKYLGLPDGLLREMMEGGDTIARLIEYPEIELNPDGTAKGELPEAVRAFEHEDIGWQTLLCRSTEGGLEVMDNEGNWHKVKAPPGSVINNGADTSQAWLKCRPQITRKLRSTTHRVTNGSGRRRLSMPFFVHPKGSTIIDPATGWTAQDYLIRRLIEIGLIEPDTLA